MANTRLVEWAQREVARTADFDMCRGAPIDRVAQSGVALAFDKFDQKRGHWVSDGTLLGLLTKI